jgi:Protein of unknown function (DUF3891)
MMFKTIHDGNLWLVNQPDHGRIAGYFAAHWGNAQFVQPGNYGPSPDPARLRAETIFAVAEHDNGWWEWEANPDLSASDGFPMGLAEVLKDPQAGMDRWRRGLNRFHESPYANLLISHHAYWLYAARVLTHPDPAFTHPLFWKGSPEKLYPGDQAGPLKFIAELEQLQLSWTATLEANPSSRDWIRSENLLPHVRLLQLCDGLSLALTSALIPARSGQAIGLGQDAFELHDVPRKGWSDRISIQATPLGVGQMMLDPYPFDLDPLPVHIPARIIPLPINKEPNFYSTWYAQMPNKIEFQFVSKSFVKNL